MLGSDGICHRTQVAVRTQTLSLAAWTDFVAGREDDDDEAKTRTAMYIAFNILQVYNEETEEALRDLKGTGLEMSRRPRRTIVQRWEQIKRLIDDALNNAITKGGQYEVLEVLPPTAET